jgi:glycosyltransferase involved in cell wall biosynthesis
VPWIAEFRDHFADNPYSNLPAWRNPIDRWIERRVVRSAAACVTVSEPMAATLRARHGKPTFVVLNGYDGAVRRTSTLSSPEAPLTILYTGIIYPGRRDPSALFAALASLGPLAKDVEVTFHGQDLRGVAALARHYHVSEQVRVLGTIAHCDALARQQAADVLLLLLWNDPREVGVYTGKFFEYVGAGRPILAAGSQDGVAAQLIRERGLGVVATDSSAIAVALRGWLKEKRSAGCVAGPPERAKTGLSRQEQFAVVDHLLHQIVEGGTHGTPSKTATTVESKLLER